MSELNDRERQVTYGARGKPLKRSGIPTVYNGIRMRSRLEAKYAAFFDRLGWAWEYEPIDLDGYIPDFIVDPGSELILFEVKGMDEELDAAKLKIEFSGWDGEAIVASGQLEHSNIGSFLERSDVVFQWDGAELFYCLSCGEVSPRPSGGDWRCRACGIRGGNSHVGEFDPAEDWAFASNRVQWRAGA